MKKLVAVSGGKDSTATLLLALEGKPEDVLSCFADTGNEHELTYEYLNYLEKSLGVEIKHLKEDFTDKWWHKRKTIAEKWELKGVSQATIDRALLVFDKGPTGNPFLDLCIIKGRFPSRIAQFCTESLKVLPMTEHALTLIDKYGEVESWQGVRAEESASRAKLPVREDQGGGYSLYRPILHWNIEQVFAQHEKHGIRPNPLYSLGMKRVGCMPCINAGKSELSEISKRFPDEIDRIAEWEDVVSQASKQGSATFFFISGDSETAFARGNITQKIKWSKTKFGGKIYDNMHDSPLKSCSSSYGLCE